MELKTHRRFDMIQGINLALLDVIITELNKLDDGEFADVLEGNRGSFSFCGGQGGFKLTETNCVNGDIENVHCPWLEEGERCKGQEYCSHFISKQEATKGGLLIC